MPRKRAAKKVSSVVPNPRKVTGEHMPGGTARKRPSLPRKRSSGRGGRGSY